MSSEKKTANDNGAWIMIGMALAFLIVVSGMAANAWKIFK